MVAPTWRSAEISAEPEPLRSADRADSAAFMVCGMASPSPSPNAASHAAANPVPLPVLVVAPNASAAAMIVNPTVTSPFTLASGARTWPPDLPGAASRVLLIIPTTRPPIRGSSRSPLPIAFAPCTSWKYCGIAKKMPNIANETSVASVVPQVNPADRNSPSSISGRTDSGAPGQPALPGHEAGQHRDPRHDGGQRRGVGPAVLARLDEAVGQPGQARAGQQHAQQSTRGRCSLRDSGSSTATAISASTTTGTLIRNTEPHQKWSSR